MEEGMKIKNLPEEASLGGIKFHDPKTKTTGYWYSQWHKGIWYKKDIKSSQIFPLFVDDLKEALEFDVIKEAI
jgi:hypothetical protein